MMLDQVKQRLLFKAFVAIMILAILPWTQGWFAGILSYQLFAGISVLTVVALATVPLLVQFHRREL